MLSLFGASSPSDRFVKALRKYIERKKSDLKGKRFIFVQCVTITHHNICINRQIDEQTNRWTYIRMDEQTDGRTNRQKYGRTYSGRTNRQMD